MIFSGTFLAAVAVDRGSTPYTRADERKEGGGVINFFSPNILFTVLCTARTVGSCTYVLIFSGTFLAAVAVDRGSTPYIRADERNCRKEGGGVINFFSPNVLFTVLRTARTVGSCTSLIFPGHSWRQYVE